MGIDEKVRRMAEGLDATPKKNEIHELAEKLHAALQRSKRFGEHTHRVEKTGGNSAAIQLKFTTPQDSVGEIVGSLQTVLRRNKYTLSEHIGGGKFTPGILISPSIAERRISISKKG